jgi:hypothetical protein
VLKIPPISNLQNDGCNVDTNRLKIALRYMKKYYSTDKYKKRNLKKSIDAVKIYRKRKPKKNKKNILKLKPEVKKPQFKGKFYREKTRKKPKIVPMISV